MNYAQSMTLISLFFLNAEAFGQSQMFNSAFWRQRSASQTFSFSFTGGDQTFVVPAGVTAITVKVWGAGGGGSCSICGIGGAGGFATASVSVTPGESLTVIVGGGGLYGNSQPGGFGGGGNAGYRDTFPSASGGGRSAIRRSLTELITAGGGGAGGPCGGSNGGPGGGTSGADGYGRENPGLGGTQLAGGASGGDNSTAGSAFQGGTGATTSIGGSGGGGGYYGGGGSGSCGAGGGGSSFVPVGGLTQAGSGQTPPMTGDARYVSGVGLGGNLVGSGGHGLVVISIP